MLIDLQIHSTYSDGYLSPTQLAEFLARNGVKVASLTDHNTLRGQQEFAVSCARKGIKTIPGLELYSMHKKKKFNILWFGYEDDPKLHSLLRESQLRRRAKARSVLASLVRRGFRIDIEKTLDRFNHYIPINRLIDEIISVTANKRLVEKELGYKNPREEDIIKNYFYSKKRKMFQESHLDIRRILELKKRIGGKIVLNHPGKNSHLKFDFIACLKKMGIDGIEVLSPHHNIGGALYFQYVARELSLLETGGSDFHKPEGFGYPLQHAWQYYKIDSRLLKGIKDIIG